MALIVTAPPVVAQQFAQSEALGCAGYRIATGPDGAVWTTDGNEMSRGGQITRIAPNGFCETYPVNGGTEDITAGPDGAVWFTEVNGQIGRMTPDGSFQEYAGGSSQMQGSHIVNGPDGALWFTDPGGNAVGRITTSGVVTAFQTVPQSHSCVLSVFCSPGPITVGSDGALWILGSSITTVYRMTTSGQISSFDVSSTGTTSLTAITSGSDGALWYARQLMDGTSRIERLTTSGSLTASYQAPASPIAALRFGPNGAAWFETGYVWSMTTNGSFNEESEPVVRSNYASPGLTFGSDRALWYTVVTAAAQSGTVERAAFVWPHADFNSDGNTDVVWQDPVTGYSQVWYLSAPSVLNPHISILGATTITTSNTWRIAAIADFDGDGHPDIVWQDPVSGSSQVWFLGGADGLSVLRSATLAGPTSWQIVAEADFNGDGRPDLVWQDPASGAAQIWYLGGSEGTTIIDDANLGVHPHTKVAGCGDFNGDGVPDIVWQDSLNGATQITYMGQAEGAFFIDTSVLVNSNAWRIVAVGDFNGDGTPDVIFQDPISGATQIWYLTGPQGTTIASTDSISGPNPWRIVGPR